MPGSEGTMEGIDQAPAGVHRILVVDDERNMVEIIKYSLEKAGFDVAEAYDGREAIEKARALKPDLMVLDVMLPVIDGYQVCKQLSTEMGMPIIMLTAKDEEIDKVLGLELGADDYLTKPFSPRELVARVRAHLRRSARIRHMEVPSPPSGEYRSGSLTINFNRREVTSGGARVDLTPREFDLLQFLVENKEKVITRETLLDHIWGYDYYGDAKIVNVTVARLREKIERDAANPRLIVTHRGVGYMFQDPGSPPKS
ncbi:MAG: response regulator transcription factor [Candidatus Eremiobacteraeota bacterium]|nr:response regulator transcription factor [Candidatus Eremiobacteraeota bacterium]